MTYAICFLFGLLTGLAFLCFLRGADTRGTDEVGAKFIADPTRDVNHVQAMSRTALEVFAARELHREQERRAVENMQRLERLYDRQGIL